MLEIWNGVDKSQRVVFRENKRQWSLVLHARDFIFVPGLFENKQSEKPNGGRMGIDAVVCEFPVMLEMKQVRADMLKCGIVR